MGIARNTKIPDTATHLLVFSKNEHGENPSPAFLKITDNMKPFVTKTDVDCVGGITVTADSNPEPLKVAATASITKAVDETGISHYSVYWGRESCDSGNAQ